MAEVTGAHHKLKGMLIPVPGRGAPRGTDSADVLPLLTEVAAFP
ncbi:hypothetical protein [Streptomyces sp. NPDC102462]